MGASAEDLYELLRSIRMDCTAIQSRVTSAFALLTELNIEDVPHVLCPKCGAKLRGPRTLEDHLHVSHPTGPAYEPRETERVAWYDSTAP